MGRECGPFSGPLKVQSKDPRATLGELKKPCPLSQQRRAQRRCTELPRAGQGELQPWGRTEGLRASQHEATDRERRQGVQKHDSKFLEEKTVTTKATSRNVQPGGPKQNAQQMSQGDKEPRKSHKKTSVENRDKDNKPRAPMPKYSGISEHTGKNLRKKKEN